MVYEFKIGDRVEITRDDANFPRSGVKTGDRGRIIKISNYSDQLYKVQCNNMKTDRLYAKELKLIKRKED